MPRPILLEKLWKSDKVDLPEDKYPSVADWASRRSYWRTGASRSDAYPDLDAVARSSLHPDLGEQTRCSSSCAFQKYVSFPSASPPF